MHWQEFKIDWQNKLASIYSPSEAKKLIQILAEERLNLSKAALLSPQVLIKEEDLIRLEKDLERLLAHEPLQYILGKAWFFNLELEVNNSVLIPRPETEELVAWILEDKAKFNSLLDIGTGSGCIPISIAVNTKETQISALDISFDALEIAQKNAEKYQEKITFIQADILDESTWTKLGNFDVIVSNPPYIPVKEKAKMHPNVLDYEPHLALFVQNSEALIFYEKIASFALKHLHKNGILYLECNEFNALDLQELIKKIGFSKIELKQDLQGKNRMLKASL
ncbi:MAG: peptide chain release factor N(5)-glutamine methyltransferase [Bacteroidetes bacterium]|nr:peptide chain release factor N(5)-glutamine methyltransferase [Bacteroidota bacterium]